MMRIILDTNHPFSLRHDLFQSQLSFIHLYNKERRGYLYLYNDNNTFTYSIKNQIVTMNSIFILVDYITIRWVVTSLLFQIRDTSIGYQEPILYSSIVECMSSSHFKLIFHRQEMDPVSVHTPIIVMISCILLFFSRRRTSMKWKRNT